ncbi:MAG: Crp/Fnr family transcriptional regulator [Nitrospirae bacterium]|nr:Crp/Fnr family transcriptional regulator [Nitrospirota bacterium]
MSNGGHLFERFGKTIPKGTVLFREGDLGQEMYIIQGGKVKISKRVRNIEKTLSIIGKGEFFGEMAILNDKPRSATGEVIEDSEILVIDRNTFETMIKGNAEIALRIIKKLAQRLQEADNQIENLMIKDNTSRVVNLLAKIAKDKGIDTVMGGVVIDNTTEDMASMLGMAREQVDKILEKIVKSRIVDIKQGRIIVTNREQLNQFMKYLEMRDVFGDVGET